MRLPCCGFDPSHIPQVASYYDFFTRFWGEDENSHLLPGLNAKPAGKKPKKNEKLVNHSSSITRDIVDSYNDSYVSSSPEDFLLSIFNKVAVDFSVSKMLLNPLATLSVMVLLLKLTPILIVLLPTTIIFVSTVILMPIMVGTVT